MSTIEGLSALEYFEEGSTGESENALTPKNSFKGECLRLPSVETELTRRTTSPCFKRSILTLQSDACFKIKQPKLSFCFNTEQSVEYLEPWANTPSNYQNYIGTCLKALAKAEIDCEYPRFEMEHSDKKLLVLDMDETLVHSDFNRRFDEPDECLTFQFEGETQYIPLFVRPGVNTFLERMSSLFEIVVFTASEQVYADVILDYLDPEKKLISKRLYRESCLKVNDTFSVKDLRGFSRELKDVVIVENNLFSFANQLDNGILVSSFYNNKQDTELSNLQGYLEKMIASAEDVRETNRQIFQFSKIKESFSYI